MKKLIFIAYLILFFSDTASANIFENLRNQDSNKDDIYTTIDKTTKFLNTQWNSDEELRILQKRPPQVLPLAANSKVYGGCGNYSLGWEVGGSSYCPRTNTIFLVPEQLTNFVNNFGPSAVAFVVAHEYGHAVQHAINVLRKYPTPVMELQADCLAGAFIKDGSKEIGITRKDTLDMANLAYAIGDPTHGSGAQRKYALSSGMGMIDYGCSIKEMSDLHSNKVDTSIVENKRSGDSKLNLNLTPFPKSVIGSMKNY